MNKIFEKVPYSIREQAANRLYNKRASEVQTHLNWLWPVCENGRCPWGVIMELLFPDRLQSDAYTLPRPGFILDVLTVKFEDVEYTYKEVSDWTNKWDQGLISPEQLKKDLGVN